MNMYILFLMFVLCYFCNMYIFDKINVLYLLYYMRFYFIYHHFHSFFLFIILLAFKHTHLISSLDVLPCIPLHLLHSCTGWAFFDKPPYPTSLNNLFYSSHWLPPLTVPRQTLRLPFHQDAGHLLRTFLLSPQSCPTHPRIPLPLPCKAASPSR